MYNPLPQIHDKKLGGGGIDSQAQVFTLRLHGMD